MSGFTNLEFAREAMRKGKHAEALKAYQEVRDADPEVLFRTAECQFRLNKYDDALLTCERIDLVTGNTSWSAPLVRGWIAERRGHKIMANVWYTQAARRGSPDGENCAARCK